MPSPYSRSSANINRPKPHTHHHCVTDKVAPIYGGNNRSDTCGHERQHAVIKGRGPGMQRGMERKATLATSLGRFDRIMEGNQTQRDIASAKSYSRVLSDKDVPLDVRTYVVDPAVKAFSKNVKRSKEYTVVPATPAAEDVSDGVVGAWVLLRKGQRERFYGTKQWTPTATYPWTVDFYTSAVVTAR